MATADVESECCQKTRARWEERIALHYASFPVIKNVPCDRCRRILEVRVYDAAVAPE